MLKLRTDKQTDRQDKTLISEFNDIKENLKNRVLYGTNDLYRNMLEEDWIIAPVSMKLKGVYILVSPSLAVRLSLSVEKLFLHNHCVAFKHT